MTRSAAEVEQTTLSEDQHAVAVLEGPHVVLRLDVDLRGEFLQAGHFDFVVEVTDVADDGLVLHLRHVVGGDDFEVARGGDEDVRLADDVFERLDLETFHRRLKGADGIDFIDDDAGALAPEALGATLADIAVAADHRDLAADHDIGRAEQAINQRMPTAVEVVELALGA